MAVATCPSRLDPQLRRGHHRGRQARGAEGWPKELSRASTGPAGQSPGAQPAPPPDCARVSGPGWTGHPPLETVPTPVPTPGGPRDSLPAQASTALPSMTGWQAFIFHCPFWPGRSGPGQNLRF